MASIARWHRAAAVLVAVALTGVSPLALTAPAAARARPRAAPPTVAQELASATAGHASAPAPVLAPGPLVWETPAGIDGGPITGLSCPSSTLCVAVDNHGNAISSTDPGAGAGAWHSLDIDGGAALAAVSCPSISICVAVDYSGNVVSTGDASTAGPAWTVAKVDPSISEPSPYGGGSDLLRGLSCPSVSLCIAVDAVGNAVVSGAPTAGAGAWAIVHIDENSDYGCVGGGLTCQAPLMGIACPTVSLCAAVDFTGNVLETTAPVGITPWPSQPIGGAGPTSLWTVSCPTASFCAAVNGIGGDVITWNPGAGVHLSAQRLPIDGYAIWCSSSALCLVSGESSHGTAELVGSTDPAANSPTWKVTDFGDTTALACPTPTMCVAADNEGRLSVGVTLASLQATLRQQAIGGRIPKIGELVRRHGYTMMFTSPLAGHLKIEWELTGAAAKAAGGTGSTPLVLATGSAAFGGPQKAPVPLSLTGIGRKLLSKAKRFTVTAAATYATNTGMVAAGRKLTLNAR